jgi:Tfp pilus assembly protein FimV
MFDSAVDTERAFGHHDAMARTYVRRRRTTLAIAATVVVTVLLGPVGNVLGADAPAGEPRSVAVRSGDTLWTIAQRIEPDADPRAVVDAMTSANGVDPDRLIPGTRLVVPAP